MQSVKNFVVTLTLLGVGYGTYIVLNQPMDQRLAQDPQQIWSQEDSQRDVSPSMGQQPSHDPPYDQEALLQPPLVSLNESPAAEKMETLESPVSPSTDVNAPRPALLPPAEMVVTEQSDNETRSQSEFADYPSTNLAPPMLAVDLPDDDTESEATDELENSPKATIDATGASAIFASVWSSVQDKIKRNELGEALFTLSVWFQDSTLNDEQRNECRDLLDQLAGTVIYSRQHHLEHPYMVKAEDTLSVIAREFGIPTEMLAKINGIRAPYNIGQGETLKVVRGPFRAEVSLENREMALFLGRYYAGRFPIHVGVDLPSQETAYEIVEKTTNRPFFDKNARKEIAANAPDNPYGGYWMGLRGDQITSGHNVGIHGTARTGQQNQRGCIGLNSLDAEDAFSILSLGSKIIVRR